MFQCQLVNQTVSHSLHYQVTLHCHNYNMGHLLYNWLLSYIAIWGTGHP